MSKAADILAALGPDDLAAQADAADTGALADLPVTVSGALGEQADIQVAPDSDEPTELTVTTIAEGSGDQVGDEGSVVVSNIKANGTYDEILAKYLG